MRKSSGDVALRMRKLGRLKRRGWVGAKDDGGGIVGGIESLPKQEPIRKRGRGFIFEPSTGSSIFELPRDGAIRACIVIHNRP